MLQHWAPLAFVFEYLEGQAGHRFESVENRARGYDAPRRISHRDDRGAQAGDPGSRLPDLESAADEAVLAVEAFQNLLEQRATRACIARASGSSALAARSAALWNWKASGAAATLRALITDPAIGLPAACRMSQAGGATFAARASGPPFSPKVSGASTRTSPLTRSG
jgi:hypothetical protein